MLKRFRLTPYRKPVSGIPKMKSLTFISHRLGRKIEHVNVMLKNRFSRLRGISNQMKNQADFVSANEQVLVCLILHNFGLRIKDAAEVETEFVPRNVDEETPQQKRGRIRNSIIEWIRARNKEIDINF